MIIYCSQLLAGSTKLSYNNTSHRLTIPKDLEASLEYKKIDKIKLVETFLKVQT